MNSNSIAATTAWWPSILPCATDQRIVQVRLVARLLQPVGVALGVAKAQRIGHDLGQFDAGEAALVEGLARRSIAPTRMWCAAMRADLQVREQVAMEDHLLAGGTLVPEVLR